MDINELVLMAERIHDTEGYDLGASSTREYRNDFWARVIGCAYHGHSVYNPTPDRQWHLKNGGGGRPQTDDVATSMPSRQYWDCIVGVGANNYFFHVGVHLEPLPSNQEVYAPPVPNDGGIPNPIPNPNPNPIPPPTPCHDYSQELHDIRNVLTAIQGQLALLKDNTTADYKILRDQIQDLRTNTDEQFANTKLSTTTGIDAIRKHQNTGNHKARLW